MNNTRTQASPLAQRLRKEAFKSERDLWEVLRAGRLAGRHFERQYIFRNTDSEMPAAFIADFYCPEERLVLSLDGDIRRPSQAIDAVRDDILYKNGLRMLRIRNEEIHDLKSLVQKIQNLFRTDLESSLLS